jgi:hypothetical protein
MPRLTIRWETNRLALGTASITVGVVVLSVPSLLSGSINRIEAMIVIAIGLVLALFGLVTTVSGSIAFAPQPIVIRGRWNSHEIRRSLQHASDVETIRILNTWLPDVEGFVATLRELLTQHGKRFQIRVLLMAANEGSDVQPGLLTARVRLRDMSADEAAQHILETKGALVKLKSQVDAYWADGRDGRTLDLQIRMYDHLPFGPLYQIGENVIYAGFFLNDNTSEHAPMLRIMNCPGGIRDDAITNRHWNLFVEQLNKAWENAVIMFPPQDRGSRGAVRPGQRRRDPRPAQT